MPDKEKVTPEIAEQILEDNKEQLIANIKEQLRGIEHRADMIDEVFYVNDLLEELIEEKILTIYDCEGQTVLDFVDGWRELQNVLLMLSCVPRLINDRQRETYSPRKGGGLAITRKEKHNEIFSERRTRKHRRA